MNEEQIRYNYMLSDDFVGIVKFEDDPLLTCKYNNLCQDYVLLTPSILCISK